MKRLQRSNKWDILILSVYQRKDQFERLLEILRPQVEKYEDVGLIVLTDDISYEVGHKRTTLVNMSKADYVCFIDDDDIVPEDYVDTIYQCLDGVTDYVGFKMAYYQNGVLEDKPVIHDAEVDDWCEDGGAWYRHITHLNPIKRSIAQLFSFSGMAREDYFWSLKVKESGLVKNPVFIDGVLYHYLRSDEGTLTGNYR